jgi:hypothetical protein
MQRALGHICDDWLRQQLRANRTIRNIAIELGVSRECVGKELSLRGIDKRLVQFDHGFFESIDTELKAYWLGFIMADGCVSMTQRPKVSVYLHPRDGQHLEKWHRAIGSSLQVRYYPRSANSDHYSARMCEDLIRLGCTPRKSLTLKFPSLPEEFIHHCVRGYFDGDGSIGWKNKSQHTWQAQACLVGTLDFLYGVKSVARLTSNPRRTQSRAYAIYVGGNRVVSRFGNWMYKDATVWLERKRAQFSHLLN